MTIVSIMSRRSTQRLLKVTALIGLCSLGAAVPALTAHLQRSSFTPLANSLEGIATLHALQLPVSLPTGTQISPPVGSGYSQLTVKNGNPVDAVFKLVDIPSGQTLRFMYVQANDTLTVDDLGTCTCDLRFATGIDWDVEQQRFRRSMALSAFSDPAEFAITIKDNREYWSTLEVTLHPVVGGNAQTETLSEDEF
jgi:hypothetical protein